MTSITLNEILEKGAWREISSSYDITLDMLEKYADKLDWRAISKNRSIPWTIDALQKFADRIDWNEFSEYCPDHLICKVFLLQFCDRWNWTKLSRHIVFFHNMENNYSNSGLLEMFWDLLEKFADKVNWGELIDQGFNIFQNPLAFFERFRQYIPIDKLQGSDLWDCMVSVRSEALWLEIGGEKRVAF